MFIVLFDIDYSNDCRCHQYFIKFLFVCVLLIHCCGWIRAAESKTALPNIVSNENGASGISTVLSQTPANQQPKPSSVIYIPSMDDVNTVVNLRSSEHDIRFEDFFWNGSGDEPLTLSLKSNARLTAMNGFVGRETFIKTATVIATVYIDDSNENENDPNCKSTNCNDNSNEIPDIYKMPHKRFWLITSVLGHLTDDDIPLLQQRLVDVYRIAFAKQQSVHLGLSNATNDTSPANNTSPITENTQSTNLSMPINPTSVLKYEYALSELNTSDVQPNQLIGNTMSTTNMMSSILPLHNSENGETQNSNIIVNVESTTNANKNDLLRTKRSVSSNVTSTIISTTSIATTTIQPTQIMLQSTNAKSQSNISDISHLKSIHVQKTQRIASTNTESFGKSSEKKRNNAIIGRISILIHNITVISLSDKDETDNSEKEWIPLTQSNFSSDPLSTTDNQTEIVYTVFVNGIPVLATIAANDMKLMSEAEVSELLEKTVFTKAEPYLKEPQATPLIPSSTATTDFNKPILALIFQNPYILAFILIMLLLILLLLIILMLLTGSKNQRKLPRKSVSKASKTAQTSQQSFLPSVPPKSIAGEQISTSNRIDDSHQIRSSITNEMSNRQSNTAQISQKQVGTQITSLHDTVDGFAYERDHSFIIIPTPSKRKHHHKKIGTPTIYFPEPPSSEPSSLSVSQSHSSTSTTSDTSSIYYIKKHKSRRHHLYSKRPKRIATLNHREYASITKKHIERAQKKSKHKRTYLKGGNGNRVGAFEETTAVQVHSSRSSSVAGAPNIDDECKQLHGITSVHQFDEHFDASTGKNSNVYEHIEAFNPLVGKKNICNQYMSVKQMGNDGNATISNEIDNHVQSKSHLIDSRQSKNDNVNHSKNGMNLFVVNTVNDKSKSKRKKIRSGNGNGDGGGAGGDVVVSSNTTDIVQPINESKCSSNMSDESIKMRTDRIPKQLSNDDVHNTTNDDLSVGSFLSMASVRSFPKCSVPEPLSRVLEPVSITYLDQYDEIEATEAATLASKLPRIVDAKAKNPSKSQITQHDSSVKPKSDEIVYLSRTRSDGADPGVIGPIAWQYHKKRLEDQQNVNLQMDATCSQHRYEDLLEGAISLYSIETTEYHTIETITKEGVPEILIGKDMRGKSADVFPTPMSTSKSSPKPYRPFTAVPLKTAPEEPLITTKGAWTGSTQIHPKSADSNRNQTRQQSQCSQDNSFNVH